MLSEHHQSIKSDGLLHNPKRLKLSKYPVNNRLLLTCKSLNEKFLDMKSMDITSRLRQFAWRQIIPSKVFLPVIFRHASREEYLCAQMVKLHLLSRFSSETLSYCMTKYPVVQYSLTAHEGELLHYINSFHSNGTLSIRNQLNYSKLDSISIIPLNSFTKFYQFLCSTAQFTNSNHLWLSSHSSSSSSSSSSPLLSKKSIADKEKAVINTMYDSSKNVLSRKNETSSSFCRAIIFHGKEILSYCTTSSMNVNEKDHNTIACLAIKDIVSIYFPWSTIDEFIQICRTKQITRFKPDKSTDYDSSLRLVNIQELENHWNFILKELLPTTQVSTHDPPQSDQIVEKEKVVDEIPLIDIPVTKTTEEILTSNVNIEQESIKSVEPSPPSAAAAQEETIVDNSLSNDNESSHLPNDIPKEINDISEIIDQQNEFEMSVTETKEAEVSEENISLENKSVKKNQRRRRRRTSLLSYSSKKRRRENLKTIDNEQFWMKKFSIEPFSICLHRYQVPLED
ncbi:hypothetical protein I4U23_006064 [Adineta vaga]|nr:hypothetical protein I4U23_006064 [Adineta vaga]